MIGTVALVPARGGSKRLPDKNLAVVGGRPLVAHAVAVAKAVADIGHVVVSSDDTRILMAAEDSGAHAVLRPAHLATDSASTYDVVRHFLDVEPGVDVVVVLQPTSPLRIPEDVVDCLAPLKEGEAAATASVCVVDHPVEWNFRLDDRGYLQPVLGWDQMVHRSQDAAPAYRLTGAVYCVTRRHIHDGGRLVGPGVVGVVLPKERSIDVDSPWDLNLVRAITDGGSAV